MESSHTPKPVDPLTQARLDKEKKAAENKGKHRAVPVSTIGRRGKIQGKNGMIFSTEEGADPATVVKREKSAGKGFFTGIFPKGAVAVGSVPQPNENTGNESSTDEE